MTDGQRRCAGVLVVIPARGGSKGLPRKNLAEVGGRTLLERAVAASVGATRVKQCIVTTDDDTIASQAEANGARIIRRPAPLAADTASSESAVRHVLDTLAAAGEVLPDITVMVQCTSPFILSQDVDGVVDVLLREGADCSVAVAPSHRFLWRRDANGAGTAVNHDASRRLPRQALEPEYVETGAAYAFRTAGFLEAGRRFFGTVALAEMDARRAIEIDDAFDLELARRLVDEIEGTAL